MQKHKHQPNKDYTKNVSNDELMYSQDVSTIKTHGRLYMKLKLKGFTLIELIIVLVITTIIIVTTTASFQSVYAKVRSDTNIRKIQQSIQFARNHAIAYGAIVTICPLIAQTCDSNWRDNITVFTDTGKANKLDGKDKIIFTIGPFHTKDSVTYNRHSIRFQPEGLSSGTNGTLIYCPGDTNSDYSRAIIVNQSGRSRFSTKPAVCN